MTATAAPRRLIRRPAPATGSSQRRHHDDTVGINHHCISATLTTWLSQTDSHGCPRGGISVFPATLRTVVPSGVVLANTEKSFVRLDRTRGKTSLRCGDRSHADNWGSVRNRISDIHLPNTTGGKTAVPS